MSIITKKSEDFLKDYVSKYAPTGFEVEGQKCWIEYIKPLVDEVHLDNYGTAYGVINPGKDYKVVIEAHADEIAWYVSYISDKGYINVKRNGGSDHLVAPAKRVNIHTRKNGIVRGVFGWPAIHTRRGDNAKLTPTLENIFVDIGAASKQEVYDMGVYEGCVLTFDDKLEVLNDKYYVARALDNRAGGFCIAEVARLLKENKDELPFSLYVVNAVQEEVGLRGAQMVTETIKPDVAIVVDVCHDTNTPLVNPKIQGDCSLGKGPTLFVAPSVHNKLLNHLVDTAEEKEIPIQRGARSRFSGTDTDAFAFSNGGVPSVLISIPQRYMHTPVEMVAKEDLENVIKLMYESVKGIENNQSWKYFEV